MRKRKKGFFSISAVAQMFSIHPQTIRLYEKEGLITPKRSEGKTRLFSEEDIDRLEEIVYLTHQMGINLAGVEMILKLKRQMKRMQKDMEKLFENATQELEQQEEETKQAVKENARRLMKIKEEAHPTHSSEPESEEPELWEPGSVDEDNDEDSEDWAIEYEESDND